MYALRKLEKVAGSLHLVKVATPEPGPGEVLLRVAACGICGSDLHAYREDPGYEFVAAPVTLGHEYAGWVSRVGPDVSAWTVGDPACAMGVQACCTCPVCRQGAEHLCQQRRVQGLHYDGGMAGYVRVDARHLVPLPPGLDPVIAALAEPLSIALHCVYDRTEILPGELVLVTGPGIIGILCALAARLRGARVILAGTEADRPVRLRIAAELRLETVAANQPGELILPDRADHLIEASGSADLLAGAFSLVRRGGSITLVGLYARPVTWFMTMAVREELTVKGSYGSTYGNYLQAISLLAAGRIPAGPLTVHYPLTDGVRAFTDALERRVLKPILIP